MVVLYRPGRGLDLSFEVRFEGSKVHADKSADSGDREFSGCGHIVGGLDRDTKVGSAFRNLYPSSSFGRWDP